MKKNCTVLVFVLFGVFIFNSCEQNHFITDKQYRRAVTDQFNQRQDLAKNRYELLFDVFQDKLSGTEKEALMFLYAYMPLNDLADYDGKYFLDQVRVSLKAKREMPWGINIPEDIFRHFVLPYRVNNENLDTFRLACYDELKERVQGLTLKDAIMEINHWCHEKVSYQPADIRTSSPMNTVKSARGRCGEESTFTVMALRTVSIPARQVYTPRWAHSDDNHAWVEVWVDGTWHYLGACEPEPDFNMGWFKEPARRAMLVHTKAFGAYNGDEQLVQKQNNFAEINSLSRYAKVKELFVNIQDTNGRSVDSASVEFKLYNFAEFYPLARLYTDKNGYTSFTTGFGYILIWSTKNGSFGFEKISVEDADTVIIILDKEPGREYDLEWDLIPA
jgi:transglutaminase-like putative cysteine protease